MDPSLRVPREVEPVDPLTLHQPPEELGRLIVEVRQTEANPDGYPDGKPLADAIPLRPLEDIARDYIAQRGITGFSPRAFWDQNYLTSHPNQCMYKAPPGMDLDTYILQEMRGRLTRHQPDSIGSRVGMEHEYSVPGERFDDLYYWDSYLAIRGFATTGDWDKAVDMVDNFANMINQYGHIFNGNCTYYAGRSQPPMFSHMVGILVEKYGDEALAHYLPAMEKEYKFWMAGSEKLAGAPPGASYAHRRLVRMADGSFLNRYWDDANGPRWESKLEDEELGERVAYGLEGEERHQRLAKLYKDLRAGAESGWDYSSRWFGKSRRIDSIQTTDIVPVDLNCLLVHTEHMLAEGHQVAGNYSEAVKYQIAAEQRGAAINRNMYDPLNKIYRDVNHVTNQQTPAVTAAMAYPLYLGIANREQAMGLAEVLKDRFLHAGGFITSLEVTGEQWDGDNVWMPPNWATIRGMARTAVRLGGYEGDYLMDVSRAGRAAVMNSVEQCFTRHGVVYEKFNGRSPDQEPQDGEYKRQTGFGMNNEGYIALKNWQPESMHGERPLPSGLIVVTR